MLLVQVNIPIMENNYNDVQYYSAHPLRQVLVSVPRVMGWVGVGRYLILVPQID